jgi:hypothetical protein
LFCNQWVIEEIREEIRKFLEFNENESTTYWNLWDTSKAVLRRNFVAMSACIKNTERSQINNLMLYLKLLEKQAQPQTSRRERMKIKAEIYKIRDPRNHINNQKTDKPLANLTKMRREKTQVNKLRNKKQKRRPQQILRESLGITLKNLYSNKLENLEEMTKILDTYDHLKLNQENVSHLNRSITVKLRQH